MPAKRFSLSGCTRVVFALGWSDFRLKYRGSVLGYLWSLLVPLSKFFVILVVLGPFVTNGESSYPLSLLLGIILWDFFAATTTVCMTALREKSDIIQRIAFPRIIIELAAVWTQVIIVLSNLCLFVVVASLTGYPPTLKILLLVPMLCIGALLAFGIGTTLAAFSLKYRDIPHLWTSVLHILFWLTPVAYPASALLRTFEHQSTIPTVLRTMISIGITEQPLSVFIETTRSILTGVSMPDTGSVLFFVFLSLTSAVIGTIVFSVRSKTFVEEL